MPNNIQRFTSIPKIGTSVQLMKKALGPLLSSSKKEGIAARRTLSTSALAPLKTLKHNLPSREKLTFPSPKKLSHFLTRPLNKFTSSSVSKEEKITQAFLKAGYEPKGHISELLQNSSIDHDRLKGKLQVFGSGQLNSVYKGHFKDRDGNIQERLIKFEASYKDEASQPEFFKFAGINGSYPKETARNLAAKALDDILAWNSIVPTQVALLKHPITQEYTVATAMENAPGVSGYGKGMGFTPVSEEQFHQYVTWKKDFEGDPDIQDTLNTLVIKFGAYDPKDAREILDRDGNLTGLEIQKRGHLIDPHDSTLKTAFLKLQLQDIILNQGDRHLGNYFIQTTDSKNSEGKEAVLGVLGIDNDLLGGTTPHINRYKQSRDEIPNKVICPPPQIPSSLCYEVLNIPVETFKSTLSLYLGKEEAEAATQRLEQVKDHVFSVLHTNIKHGEDSLLYPYHTSNSYWMNFLDVHFPEEAKTVRTLSSIPA